MAQRKSRRIPSAFRGRVQRCLLDHLNDSMRARIDQTGFPLAPLPRDFIGKNRQWTLRNSPDSRSVFHQWN